MTVSIPRYMCDSFPLFTFTVCIIICSTTHAAVHVLGFLITSGTFGVTNDFEYMQKVTQYTRKLLHNSFCSLVHINTLRFIKKKRPWLYHIPHGFTLGGHFSLLWDKNWRLKEKKESQLHTMHISFLRQDPTLNSHLSLSCLRHGTVFLMQVPLSGSTSSTMTNGASSRVTMDRWSSRSSAAEYRSKRGHTWYLIVREPLSHLPTCVSEWVGGRLCDIQATVTGTSSDRQITEGEKYTPGKQAAGRLEEERKEGTRCKEGMIEKETILTLSHCLSLSRRMMTSLGNIWWPSSLNDRFRPSNVTFMRYLRMRIQVWFGSMNICLQNSDFKHFFLVTTLV